jgi:acetoin utilization protein AcuB
MTHHPITVPPDMPITEALKTMRENGVRRFPVIDPKTHELVGIVTEKELLYASPSPVTSLSVHEMHYLLSKVTVERIMSTELTTVTEDTAIEEAARIMVDQGVGALPVMREGTLVGIITETDVFKTFIELFAARQEGIRLTLLVPDRKGEVAAITRAIAELDGDIVSLGTFQGEDLSNRLLAIKVADVSRDELERRMRELEVEVIDARACLQAVAC